MKIKMKLAWINARHWAAAVVTSGMYVALLLILPAYAALLAIVALRDVLRGDPDESKAQIKGAVRSYIGAWKGVTELVKECLQ